MKSIICILLINISNFLFFQQKFSKAWDIELNRLMSEDDNPEIGEHTVGFNVDGTVYEVWSCNAFYSFGHIHRIDGIHVPEEMRRRPKARTMLKLTKIIGDSQKKRKQAELNKFMDDTGFKSI